jgi:hypothetical protein
MWVLSLPFLPILWNARTSGGGGLGLCYPMLQASSALNLYYYAVTRERGRSGGRETLTMKIWRYGDRDPCAAHSGILAVGFTEIGVEHTAPTLHILSFSARKPLTIPSQICHLYGALVPERTSH